MIWLPHNVQYTSWDKRLWSSAGESQKHVQNIMYDAS